MNYQSLVYFKTVAELQHYTRAADELFITQPALSKAIRNLELELGCSLFRKDGRNVVLTEYGSCFYEYVKRAVDEINRGVEVLKHMVDLENNTVFISALYSMYSTFLPDAILQFRKRQPLARFSLEHKFTTAVLEDVLNKKSELGICSNFDMEGKYSVLRREPLYQEKLCLVVSKDHPFAKRGDKVSVTDLRDERFIVYIWSNLGTNKILQDMCNRHGFEPNIYAEGYNDYGVLGMVAAGEGIAIMPVADIVNNSNVVRVEIDTEEELIRTIHVVWRKDEKLPPMVADFRDALIADAAKLIGSGVCRPVVV